MKAGTAAAFLMLLSINCDEGPPPCPPVDIVAPAIGTGPATSGLLVPDAQAQMLTISSDRQTAEYTFTRDGVIYTARYQLQEGDPPPALSFVSVRRPPPLQDCAALVDRGPVIDGVEVRRGGKVVAVGESGYFATDRCPMQQLTSKADERLRGAPDGSGAPLADAEYGWRLSDRTRLLPGDEITVTVLDGTAEPFEVYVGSTDVGHTTKLGTLRGTGSVVVP